MINTINDIYLVQNYICLMPLMLEFFNSALVLIINHRMIMENKEESFDKGPEQMEYKDKARPAGLIAREFIKDLDIIFKHRNHKKQHKKEDHNNTS